MHALIEKKCKNPGCKNRFKVLSTSKQEYCGKLCETLTERLEKKKNVTS